MADTLGRAPANGLFRFDGFTCYTSLRNFALDLPEPLLRRFRIYLAERNQSMTSLIEGAIRNLLDENGNAARAKRLFLGASAVRLIAEPRG
jgi:hypothetical protein